MKSATRPYFVFLNKSRMTYPSYHLSITRWRRNRFFLSKSLV